MTVTKTNRTLVIGIGNDSRADDGLGWKFVERAEKAFPHLDWRQRFQLQVEDAALISRYDEVIFVDATHNRLKGGFKWSPCKVSMVRSFSTHHLDPSTVLSLARELYACKVKGSVLAIEGATWGIQMGLSQEAVDNLDRAMRSFEGKYGVVPDLRM